MILSRQLRGSTGFAIRRLCTTIDDASIHNAYRGLIPKLKTIYTLVTDKKEGEKFENIFHKSLIPNVPANLLIGLKLYTGNIVLSNHLPNVVHKTISIDLNHPLLKKYDFDVYEFAEGVKDAYKKIILTYNSHEFSKFAKNMIDSSKKQELLQSVMFPRAYRTNLQIISLLPFETHLSKVELKKIFIASINVDIVGNELSKFARAYIPDDAYPPGSVLVHVTILFLTDEIGFTEMSSIREENTDRNIKREITWTACISGHVNFEWKISKAFKLV